MRSGAYSQKQFFTVLHALLFSAQVAGQLFSLSPEIMTAGTAETSVFQLLSFKPTILEPDVEDATENRLFVLQADRSQKISQRSGTAKFEFERISFSYSADVTQKALDNVTFTINSGEAV